jgi:hypothetical protein
MLMAYKTWLKQGRYVYVGTEWESAPTIVITDITKDQITWRFMSVNNAEMNLKDHYAHRPL